MTEYIPYGALWEKEMMKFNKVELIRDVLRPACKEESRLRLALAEIMEYSEEPGLHEIAFKALSGE